MAGAFRFKGRGGPTGDSVREMSAELAHRGPDDVGELTRGSVSLGFRRLALNDLVSGNQPHFSGDDSVVSICNGEIFNHRDLRRKLERAGYRFRTECDTEVLVYLYQEYGVDLTDHLDGQFAFAVHDGRADRLLLARDHFGVIPLFYTTVAGCFLFASEIKAILRHPEVQRRVDMRGLDQVLSLPGLVSPQTMFEGIYSLRPGERAIVDRSGVRIERYWDLRYPPLEDCLPVPAGAAERELARHAERVADLLDSSVRRRLTADVPVGMYLSGGLDSSLIGGLMTKARPGHAWPGFSVAFPGRDFDEEKYQQLVAGKLGVDHHILPMGDGDIRTSLSRAVRHSECPIRESYNVCSLLLSRAVRASGTVAILSGEGADELFGGYPGYRFQAAGLGGRHLTGVDAQFERQYRRRMWGTETFYEQNELVAQDMRRELYSDDLAVSLDEFSITAGALVDADRVSGRHPLHQRSYLDFHLRLADHLLGDHGDRMAMAHGVELRFPFLSKEMVEYVCTIPPELMLHGGQDKAVLRQAAAGLVPGEVLRRPKFGFRGPTSADLLRDDADWFEDLICPQTIRRQGYFNAETVAALARRQREGAQELHPHREIDYLMVVATFTLFVEEYELPCRG